MACVGGDRIGRLKSSATGAKGRVITVPCGSGGGKAGLATTAGSVATSELISLETLPVHSV